MDGGGTDGGRWSLTGENLRNEGTGLDGKVERSLRRQELKDVSTRENLSLRRFAIFATLDLSAVAMHKTFLRKAGHFYM